MKLYIVFYILNLSYEIYETKNLKLIKFNVYRQKIAL